MLSGAQLLIIVVRHDAHGLSNPSGLADQARHRIGVDVANLASGRGSMRRHDFIAHGNDSNARAPSDLDESYAQGHQPSQVLGPQELTSRKDQLPTLDVFAHLDHVLARRDRA